MRIALFADVHGNITGLKAVCAAIDRLGGADVVIAAGDHIGGGPGTEDVLDLMVARGVRLVRGNADEAWLDPDAAWSAYQALFPRYPHWVPPPDDPGSWLRGIRTTAEWLHARMGRAYWDLLRGLPLSECIEVAPGRRLAVYHASPRSTWHPHYAPDEVDDAVLRECFGDVDADVVAHGHVHRHHVLPWQGRVVVNVASVGKRPGDGLSAFTLVEFARDRWTIRQHQVPYDAHEEARLMAERGVPR